MGRFYGTKILADEMALEQVPKLWRCDAYNLTQNVTFVK